MQYYSTGLYIFYFNSSYTLSIKWKIHHITVISKEIFYVKSLHRVMFKFKVVVIIILTITGLVQRTPRFRVKHLYSFSGLLEITQLNSKVDIKQ